MPLAVAGLLHNRNIVNGHEPPDAGRGPFLHSVSLVDKLNRLTPATWIDSDKMDPYAIILGYLDAYAHVLVPGKKQGITNRLLTGEFDEIRHNEGIDTLLLARRVDETQTHLDIIELGKPRLF